MASTSASSTLSRARPVILLATGLAAACGIYLVYTTFGPSSDTAPKAKGLRRSNAVHRLRSRSMRISQRARPIDQAWTLGFVGEISTDHPFGLLRAEHQSHHYEHSIGDGAPEAADIASALRLPDAERLLYEIQYMSVSRIMLKILDGNSTRPELDYGPAVEEEFRAFIESLRDGSLMDLNEGASVFETYWAYDEQVIVDVLNLMLPDDGRQRIHRGSRDSGVPIEDVEILLDDWNSGNSTREDDHGIKALLYHIAEEEAKRQAYVHRGTTCDSCGALPIRGTRYHCLNCPDYDLCATCEGRIEHDRGHVFAKIKTPIPLLRQPHYVHKLWYPGDPRLRPGRLQPAVEAKITKETGFDSTKVQAYYDQFICLVNRDYRWDSSQVNCAMDKIAFRQALTSDHWPPPLAPNVLYDRMFDFYDTNSDGLIGFEEFVSGLAFIFTPAKRTSMARTFRGYDFDNDGFVSRRDFIRLLSAKYALHKTLILDNTQVGLAVEGRFRSSELVQTSRPLSAAYLDADPPEGESRVPRNKPLDRYGEPQLAQHELYSQTVLPDGETEIDNSFWNAVFDRHGRPDRLTDLHPQFNESLDARRTVRQRYVGSEILGIGTGDPASDSYLVTADSRSRRRHAPSDTPLTARFYQDLGAIYGQRGTDATVQDVLERDRTYQVPTTEKGFTDEVLFQVIQDGFNEMIDPLFKAKEDLARQVGTTVHQRKRYRQQIDANVASKSTDAGGSKSTREAAESHAPDDIVSNRDSGRGQQGPESTSAQPDLLEDDNAWSTDDSATDDDVPSANAAADHTTMNGHTQSAETSVARVPENAAPRHVDEDRNDPSEEISAHITRLQLQPTDEESLRNMEESIRRQPVEDLLQSQGYSIVDSPSDESAPNNSRSRSPSPESPLDATTVPANPEQPSQLPDGSHDNVTADFGPTPMHLSPSSPQTPPVPDTIQELPDTPETFQSSSRSVSLVSGPSNPESEQNESAQAQIQSEVNGHGENGSSEDKTTGKKKEDEEEVRILTEDELERFAKLDKEEALIVQRGGPARINLEEFEQIVHDAQRAGNNMLRGLVETWLEWAAL